jgi:hypothetical protein
MEYKMRTNTIENLEENICELLFTLDSEKATDIILKMIKELVAQGISRKDILLILDKYRQRYSNENKFIDEENIIAVMAILDDWCSEISRIK